MHNWFASYLKDRSQVVKIGSTFSDSCKISLGVPQGSVLGPILFLVYINSIFTQKLCGKVTAFADDLGITYAESTQFNLVANINHDVELLRKWFTAHKLLISDKTRLMYVNLSRQESPSINIDFHDANCQRFKLCSNSGSLFDPFAQCHRKCFKIEPVEHFKYLGIILDKNLNWRVYINSLKTYFRSVIRKLYQLSKISSTCVLKMFYYSLYHSKLCYGITCRGGAYMNLIKSLLTLQKCAIRLICNKTRCTPSFPLFKSLSILPIRHLFYYSVIKKFVSKHLGQACRLSHVYNLRNSSNVSVPRFRTTTFRNSFPILSCRLFNLLPQALKNMPSTPKFLREIKIWILNFNF